MDKNLSILAIQDKIYAKGATKITIEELFQLTKSAGVKHWVAMAKAAATRGDKKAKDDAKRNLQCLLLNGEGLTGNGERKNINTISGRHCGVDFDDIPNPQEVYEQRIKGREVELDILAVHPSASYRGLHILFNRKWDETIPAAQRRIAAAFGLHEDTACSDPSRAGYISDDWYYIADASKFYYKDEQEMKTVQEHFTAMDQLYSKAQQCTMHNGGVSAGCSPQSNRRVAGDTAVCATAPQCENTASYTVKKTWAPDYNGIPYRDLIDNYIILIKQELGLPSTNAEVNAATVDEGTRHTILKNLYVGMRSVFHNNSTALLVELPTFGLDEKERLSLVQWLNDSDAGKEPTQKLRVALSICKAKYGIADDEEETADTVAQPTLPLPALLRYLTDRLPTDYRVPCILSLLPVLGTLLTGIRFRYIADAAVHSLSFMTFLCAEQASGKSWILEAAKLAAAPLYDNDAIAAEEWRKYTRACKRAERKGDEDPEEPNSYFRLVGVNSSAGKLAKKMAASNNHHLYTQSAEISGFVAAGKQTFGPQREIYKLAFDNDEYSGDKLNDDSFSGHVNVYYNLFFAGTPAFIDSFFRQNTEDGLVTRWVYTSIHQQFAAEMPCIRPYTNAELAAINEITRSLTVHNGFRFCPWIDEATRQFVEAKRQQAIATGSKAVDKLRLRCAVMLSRIGYLLSELYGCALRNEIEQPKNSIEEQAAAAWATYMAEKVFQTQLDWFGDMFDTENTERKHAVTDILAMLPDTFSMNDLTAACQRVGKYTDNAYVLRNRWLHSHAITADASSFTKVRY